MSKTDQPDLFLEGAISVSRQSGEKAQQAYETICYLNCVHPSYAPVAFKFAIQRRYMYD